jgi:type IX secretion system PorP/SprF family membrane protein
MARYILIFLIALISFTTVAQNRILFTNTAQLQSYYNPSLSGFQGSIIRSVYRSQWTGFEDAPKTIFASAEIDTKLLQKQSQAARERQAKESELGELNGLKHAIGFTALHDKFGPSRFTQLSMSYGAGIRLTEALALRWGTAITFQSNYLDGNSLTVDQENDPRYRNVIGNNSKINKADLNVGLALTSSNFMLGYSLQDVTKGSVFTSGDDYLEDMYSMKHNLMTGYRTNLSDKTGIIVNTLYQYDKHNKGVAEGQIKGAYDNIFWVGAGYRQKLAYHITAGIRFHQLIIGYAYETPVSNNSVLNQPSNEVSLSYNLINLNKNKTSTRVSLW